MQSRRGKGGSGVGMMGDAVGRQEAISQLTSYRNRRSPRGRPREKMAFKIFSEKEGDPVTGEKMVSIDRKGLARTNVIRSQGDSNVKNPDAGGGNSVQPKSRTRLAREEGVVLKVRWRVPRSGGK